MEGLNTVLLAAEKSIKLILEESTPAHERIKAMTVRPHNIFLYSVLNSNHYIILSIHIVSF